MQQQEKENTEQQEKIPKENSSNTEETNSEILCEGSIQTKSFEKEQTMEKTQKKYLQVDFILPFTREIFDNQDEQEKLFKDTIASIRKNLHGEDKNNITVMKKQIEKKDGKRLHAIRILAPPQLEKQILELKLKGIDVRGRTLMHGDQE